MTIEKNKVVSVNYILTTFNNGSDEEILVEETSIDNPFVFLFGNGDLLEDFESALLGKSKGEKFDFRIGFEKGYGASFPDHIIDVPINAFKNEEGEIDQEMVVVGNYLPMHDQEGNRLQGLVVEITDDFVKMDFNHPLAGKNLHFTGEVLEVRPATLEELSHGHVHGPGGHHH
ncbi:MAG: FKBP-type peptidyl-prolyl cis-trans isomerase [Bacteroidia bacterium]|nr:FKBP-type peptidyl-prolyl cis-trans isomerase [Bacteroidia bacterium]MCZ2247352.1 FKBP-type peptidyl-prolyl cis-trans isomerase [Bacteroidia bacterium]